MTSATNPRHDRAPALDPSTTPRLRVIREEDRPTYDADHQPPTVWRPMIPAEVVSPQIGTTALSVYVVLAQHARHKATCNPSVTTIAAALGISENTVRRAIVTLESAQCVVVQHRTGTAHSYYLPFQQKPSTPSILEGETPSDVPDDPFHNSRAPLPLWNPTPSKTEGHPFNYGTRIRDKEELKEKETLTPPLPPRGGDAPKAKTKPKRVAYSPEFTTFWNAYPHHAGRSDKPKAFEHWQRLGLGNETDSRAEVMAGLQRQTPHLLRDGGQYAPGAHVWLKGQRWESESTVTAQPTDLFANRGSADRPNRPPTPQEILSWFPDDLTSHRSDEE